MAKKVKALRVKWEMDNKELGWLTIPDLHAEVWIDDATGHRATWAVIEDGATLFEGYEGTVKAAKFVAAKMLHSRLLATLQAVEKLL